MGWKSKFLFMLIIYFAGFATAVYYLAPPGENNLTVGYSQEEANSTMSDLRGKITASLSGISKQDFKDAYERSVQAVKKMVENGKNLSVKSE